MSEPCTEKEKIGIISNMVENLEKSFKEFKKESKEDMGKIHDKLDKFIDSANKTYATKTELYWLIPICGLAIIGFLVINKLI